MENGKNVTKYIFSDILKKRRKEFFKAHDDLAEAMLPPKDEDTGKQAAKIYDTQVNTLRRKIGRWESGLAEPSVSEFKKLCDLLQCDPEYLWGICPTPRREVKNVMEYTGLSEKAVEVIVELNNCTDTEPGELSEVQILSRIIEDRRLAQVLGGTQLANNLEAACNNPNNPFTAEQVKIAETIIRSTGRKILDSDLATWLYRYSAGSTFENIISDIQ